MPTTPIYDQLLQEVTDELERKVFEALSKRNGQPMTRGDLVFEIFGEYVQKSELSSNTNDRKIREAIERLRKRDFPIHSSSGEAGYMLTADEEAIDEYIGEQEARIERLRENIIAARRSKVKARLISVWTRSQTPAVQKRLL